MNKAVVGGVVVGVLVIGAVGGSWYTGKAVETAFHEGEGQEYSSNSGRVSVKYKTVEYERSLFGAKARTEWMLNVPGADEAQGIKVYFDHDIHHGPLPSMKLATIQSRLELPEQLPAEIREVLKTALNGRSLLEADSSIGWDGKSHQTTLVSPALDLTFQQNVQVTWGGLNADLSAKSEGAQRSSLTIPALSVNVPAEAGEGPFTFKLENLASAADMAPLAKYPALANANVSFTIERLTVTGQEQEGQNIAVNGIRIATEARADDQFMSVGINMGVDKVVAQGETVENPGLELRFERLGLAPLNSIAEKMKDASADDVDEELQHALMQNAVDFLKQQPVIELKRIGFKANEGEFNVGARVAYVGEGDVSRPPTPADVDADLQLAIAQPLLERMLAGSVGAQQAAMAALFNENHDEGEPDLEKMAREVAVGIISQFQQIGLLKADSGKLTLNFQNKKGQMVLNEQPVAPEQIAAMFMGAQHALQGGH